LTVVDYDEEETERRHLPIKSSHVATTILLMILVVQIVIALNGLQLVPTNRQSPEIPEFVFWVYGGLEFRRETSIEYDTTVSSVVLQREGKVVQISFQCDSLDLYFSAVLDGIVNDLHSIRHHLSSQPSQLVTVQQQGGIYVVNCLAPFYFNSTFSLDLTNKDAEGHTLSVQWLHVYYYVKEGS